MAALIGPGVALAQTSSGTLGGRVTYENQALPGVTVVATSPSMQGQRVTVTSGAGDYLLPGLPGGTYTVAFQLSGFHTLEQEVKISASQNQLLDAVMASETVTAEIDVVARYDTVGTAVAGAETVEQAVIEQLPVDRDINAAVALTAGTAEGLNGPSIAGSTSVENLYTQNGVVLNETIRQQAMPSYIEDAIQETTVLTSGVSAEYGRFTGGVVNMITKSGGNEFSGSFRASFDNDSWSAETPLTTDQVDDVNSTLEATLGGYLWKDRVWFFLAGRDRSDDVSRQTYISQIPWNQTLDDSRVEAKVTALLTQNHRLTANYNYRDFPASAWDFGAFPSMDLDSVGDAYGNETTGWVANYTGLFGDSFALEAQYSANEFTIIDGGGNDPTLEGGTPIVDYVVNGTYHAPWFCGEPCRDEERDNENLFVKGSWFVSGDVAGSHELVFGFDSFSDKVLYDNHQSASDYQIWTIYPPDFSSGTPLLQLYPGAGLVVDLSLVEPSQRTKFTTNSYYVNDSWRVSNRLSLNIGVRYDDNDGTDAGGAKVVDDSRWSPRLGLSWDPLGDGNWAVNASAGRYTSSIRYTVANQGTGAGRPATLAWLYLGPPVLASQVGGNDAALGLVFDWFFSPANPYYLFLASIPGLNTQIGDSLGSPYVDEMTVGFSKRLGSEGVLRVDYVNRSYAAFYSLVNEPYHWVSSPSTGLLDLNTFVNEDTLLEREYDGLLTRLQYRVGERWNFGGNWTLSHLRGTWDGESAGSGAIGGDVGQYAEYKDMSWFAPRGDLVQDQRHKINAWAIWDPIMTNRHHLSVSVLESFNSGMPYGSVGIIDNSLGLAYVGFIGYRTPPSSLPYYFENRDAYRTDDITRTDLAINYSFSIGAVELYIQPEAINIFNEQGAVDVDRTVYTSYSAPPGTLQPFNPLSETPVEGVHWIKSDTFGQPIREEHYQQPRTYRFSVGVRF
jgi:outer membrane receptor protein involved in Fe transport